MLGTVAGAAGARFGAGTAVEAGVGIEAEAVVGAEVGVGVGVEVEVGVGVKMGPAGAANEGVPEIELPMKAD